MQDVRNVVVWEYPRHHVYVIWHDAPCKQPVPALFEQQKSLGYDLGHLTNPKRARSCPAIEILFDPDSGKAFQMLALARREFPRLPARRRRYGRWVRS